MIMKEESKGYDAEMLPFVKIFIGEIIIDDTNSVTIFGYLPNGKDELERCDFVCKMHLLTEMLLHAGAEGDAMIDIISEGLNDAFDGLLRVDAVNLFGKPVEITNLVFVVYQAKEMNDDGEYAIPDDCYYFIDNIQTMEDYLENGIRVSQNIEQSPEENLEDAIISLLGSYKHYLRLIDGGDTETQAREDSALTNETLFDLAELYYKVRNKNS